MFYAPPVRVVATPDPRILRLLALAALLLRPERPRSKG